MYKEGSVVVLQLLLLIVMLQGDARPKDTRLVAVVQGCLEGSTLKVTSADTEGVRSDTYRLKIPKSLSATMKELRGHELELTGLLTDRSTRMGGSKNGKIGSRTKISVGASDEQMNSNDIQKTDLPQLEVQSFRDVAPGCKH
jgi:hypothetical protein